MLRIGLIGLGEVHVAHVQGYRLASDKAVLTAVCDRDGALAEARGKEYGAAVFTDYMELLENGDVDAVDIMLPHSAHEAAILAALDHGKHVLVEKPLAPSLMAVERVIARASETGLTVAVAENTRFVRAYQAVERILATGSLGSIEFVRTVICGNELKRLSNRNLWKGRRDGTVGGVILDSGAHSFYLLRWLFGMVNTIGAYAAKRVQASEVEDMAVVVGSLDSGANFATEYVFTAAIPWSERLEVYGSEGSLIVDQLANPVVKRFHGSDDQEGAAVEGVPYWPGTWKSRSMADEIVEFVTSVVEGRSFPVSLDYLRDVAQIIDAAYGSLEALRVRNVRDGGADA